jgi:hypothetical protein
MPEQIRLFRAATEESGCSHITATSEMISLFQKVAPPRDQSKLAINRCATWYTWSPSFRLFIRNMQSTIDSVKRAPMIDIPNLNDFNHTFSLPLTAINQNRVRQDLLRFAHVLFRMRVPRRLILFTDLLNEDLDSHGLHVLFALFRAALAKLARDDRHALYQPLIPSRDLYGGFPLHADLYIPEMLLNVFDNVPTDASGASIFLKVSVLRRLMASLWTLPQYVRAEILDRFLSKRFADQFNVVYNLLHGVEHAWVPELENRMRKNQLRIKLYRGQGYLIHDRTWLHGRQAAYGGVKSNRAHRLAFSIESLIV